MGEPAGVGPEITLKAWQVRHTQNLPPFVVLADPEVLAMAGEALSLTTPLKAVTSPQEALAVFADALPVLPVDAGGAVTFGKPSPLTAGAVIRSISEAVRLAESGAVAGVVTNPIQKSVLYDAGFKHPGHTEFIAELTGGARPIMMLAIPGLRVVPLTIHIPLAQVASAITTAAIIEVGQRVLAALRRDFAITTPRLAVAGLNPHAGEGGALGREEIDIIAPAVTALRQDGWMVRGPYPPDSLFSEAARATYDAALCMYHDQALIPLKALDFERGVNITLGLSIIRTSPDHGTALDIAGRGLASAESLIAALHTARCIAGHRQAYS